MLPWSKVESSNFIAPYLTQSVSMIPIVFGTNLAAPDFLRMFTHPAEWAQVRERLRQSGGGLRIPREMILARVEGEYTVGPNYYGALVAVDAFRKIREWGLALVVGVGAVGQDDCDGRGHTAQTLQVLADIEKAGGKVDYLIVDSPFSFSRFKCGAVDVKATARVLADFIRNVQKAHNVQIGFVDGHPTWSIKELGDAWAATAIAGRAPAFLAVDVDRGSLIERDWWQRLLNWIYRREAKGFRDLRAQWEVTRNWSALTVMELWAESSSPDYRAAVLDWARFVRSLTPPPDAIIVETWTHPRAVPKNLPESDPASHTNLVLEVARVFEGV